MKKKFLLCRPALDIGPVYSGKLSIMRNDLYKTSQQPYTKEDDFIVSCARHRSAILPWVCVGCVPEGWWGCGASNVRAPRTSFRAAHQRTSVVRPQHRNTCNRIVSIAEQHITASPSSLSQEKLHYRPASTWLATEKTEPRSSIDSSQR